METLQKELPKLTAEISKSSEHIPNIFALIADIGDIIDRNFGPGVKPEYGPTPLPKNLYDEACLLSISLGHIRAELEVLKHTLSSYI